MLNACLFLPLCSKGHTIFSLVDCWEMNGEGQGGEDNMIFKHTHLKTYIPTLTHT